MPKVNKLQREPLTRRAVQAIRDAIFAGEYEPGQRLVEEELADGLGVSRNVVREAFWQLEAQGLVHNDDYKGKTLTSLSVADMVELIPMRLTFESMAAVWASRNITPEGAAALRKQAARFTQGLANFSAYCETDFELHQMIWKLAGNHHMAMMLDRIAGPMIALQSRLCQSLFEELIRKETEAREGSHVQVVEAICTGGRHKAGQAMQSHILAFWHMWLTQASAAGESRESQEAIHDAMTLVAKWASVLNPSGERLLDY